MPSGSSPSRCSVPSRLEDAQDALIRPASALEVTSIVVRSSRGHDVRGGPVLHPGVRRVLWDHAVGPNVTALEASRPRPWSRPVWTQLLPGADRAGERAGDRVSPRDGGAGPRAADGRSGRRGPAPALGSTREGANPADREGRAGRPDVRSRRLHGAAVGSVPPSDVSRALTGGGRGLPFAILGRTREDAQRPKGAVCKIAGVAYGVRILLLPPNRLRMLSDPPIPHVESGVLGAVGQRAS